MEADVKQGKPGMRRSLKVLLALSLGLNMLVIGAIGGMVFRGGPAAVRGAVFGAYTRALSHQDRREIGQHPAKPTLVHIVHTNPHRVHLNGLAGLALRTDQEHILAFRRQLGEELPGCHKTPERLLRVDNVNGITPGKDVGFHLRIPPADAVPEMNSGINQIANYTLCQYTPPLCSAFHSWRSGLTFVRKNPRTRNGSTIDVSSKTGNIDSYIPPVKGFIQISVRLREGIRHLALGIGSRWLLDVLFL